MRISVNVKMVSSLKARVFLVEQVFRSSGEYTEEVQQESAEMFTDIQVPHRNAVWRLIAKFLETELVADLPRSGRPAVLTEEERLDISDRILQTPTKSFRKMQTADGCLIRQHTRKVLKKDLHLLPYKMTSVHELKPRDNVKRIDHDFG
jgi:hypothetical protein